MYQWAVLVADLLKGIAWPLMIFGVAWVYKDDVKAAFPRLIEAGPGGLKLSPPTTQLAEAASIEESTSVTALPSSTVQLRELVSPEELDPMVSNLRAVPSDVRDDPAAREVFLLTALAVTAIRYNHEQIYRLIYGSQLRLLLQMNGVGGASREAANAVFDEARRTFPEMYVDTTFERWIDFLTLTGLAALNDDEHYEITAKGRGLLRYILDKRLPSNKAF